ncbi:carbon monoxide dehydrogenase subunit G [Cryobacterium sp. MP_M5]|uniref:SRPBCC family protein n=1 Tax=unclassified Cryobacterium TaxID=2649013 RepID=UPI0018C933B1|nr:MULTISPECIES: SRPBCC family protein [unclassified Cryobacterium]MBG6059356.1 carbon monoxide dehydrogenase subunit G [Cryobacterium sp. MP_M3]MEC5177796.1 carbon monoxide dehydrogenase subunit G [Cryobacterium sp. MP_M5]
MQLDSTFTVVAPIDTVWESLMDFERVAGCVPGAEVLNKLSDDAYQVGMKVKLGPVSMQYKGLMNVIERDATAHRAVFQGRAQEARGQGTAQGTATLSLVETDGTTTGTVSAEVDLSGKVAAMGKSIIGSVTDQMMALFADNLQAMVTGSGTEPTAPPAAGEPAAAPAPAQTGSQASPPPMSRPLQHQAPRTADTSLNALDLAKGMLADQLSNPGKLIGVLAGVAFLAYRIGRAVGRRGSR